MNAGKSLALVVSASVVAMAASAWSLGAMFGPTDNGMRCERSAAGSECRLLRTKFIGLLGNSSFSVPESAIRDATVGCATGGVGGHHGSGCAVYLILGPGSRQVVSSYALRPQAEVAARQIRAYLGDRSRQTLVIGDSVVTPVLLYGILPVAVVLVAVGVGMRRHRRRALPS